MPIVSLNRQLAHLSCSACAKGRDISVDSLMVGSRHSPNIIVLPACNCGAIESLNRTFDNPSAHAYFVNTLHEHLVQANQVNAPHQKLLSAEKTKPSNRALSLTSDDLTPPEPFDAATYLRSYLSSPVQ